MVFRIFLLHGCRGADNLHLQISIAGFVGGGRDAGDRNVVGTSAAAYELYLRGMGFLQRWDRPENVAGAIEAFAEASHADPHFAAAFVSRRPGRVP